MTNLNLPNLSYANLRKLLVKPAKLYTLAYKTQAARWDAEVIHIRHHEHSIAAIHPEGVIVSNAGWHSKTTAHRLHRVLKDNGIPWGIGIRNGRTTLLAPDTLKPVGSLGWVQFTLIDGIWTIALHKED